MGRRKGGVAAVAGHIVDRVDFKGDVGARGGGDMHGAGIAGPLRHLPHEYLQLRGIHMTHGPDQQFLVEVHQAHVAQLPVHLAGPLKGSGVQ